MATDPGGVPPVFGRETAAAEASGTVEVRRSGGFAGRTTTGRLAPGDARHAEVTALLKGIDFLALRKSSPQPDRFTFVFVVGDDEVTVHEQDLTDDLQRVASVVLRDDC